MTAKLAPPIRVRRRPKSLPVPLARVRLNRHSAPFVVAVTRSPWASPFRIVADDEDDLRGPCNITWTARGAGRLRSMPPGFELIHCANRLEAQELIKILFRDWLLEPDRSGLLERIRTELPGKLLGCRCNPRTPCHGDVLLELANRDCPDSLLTKQLKRVKDA
jgi:hypothetical protein